MQPAGCPCVFGFVSTLVSTLDSACLWGRASFWCILTWQFLQSELDFSPQFHVNSLWVCWQTVQGWILVYNSYVGNKCVWYLMEIFWPMLQWKLMLNFVKAFVPCTFFFFFLVPVWNLDTILIMWLFPQQTGIVEVGVPHYSLLYLWLLAQCLAHGVTVNMCRVD